jgi:hypothetical protein
MIGRQKILLSCGLVALASVLIPRVSYTSVRTPFRYLSKEIAVTLPSGWVYDDEPKAKENGTRVLEASEAPAASKKFTDVGVEVLHADTFGARTTTEFFVNRKKRWLFQPKGPGGQPPIEGDWQLDETTAHYIEWQGDEQSHVDAYILAPNGKGWHLEFVAPHDRIVAMMPVFEQITGSMRFDVARRN